MSDRDCENCKHHTEKGCDSWDCKFEQGIKRKEIIEMLKVLKEQALKSHNDTAIIDVKKDSFIYVMNVTINSLEIDERYELEYEQIEPCEDAISRQAVIDEMEKRHIEGDSITKGFVKNMPSVNPQEPILDKIRAEIVDIEEGISSYYNDRPWIFKDEALDIIDKYVDPFYSTENQKVLKKSIRQLNEGHGKEQEPRYENAEPKTDVLDKIIAEIKETRKRRNVGVMECLDIIDRYKAESEEGNDTDI